MRILNSTFNIDDLVKFHSSAEEWYKQNFAQFPHMFPLIESMCKETFKIYEIVKYYRHGNIELHVCKMSELNNGSSTPIIFHLDSNGHSIDPKLCWIEFGRPLFERVR